MGSGPNRKSKSFSSSETTLALASLVASASAAITRCISFAKHTSLISTLVCKRGRKFIFWPEIMLKGKYIWLVYLFAITMNKDSPEDMYSPLVRCTLKVRRQLLCNFLPRKIMYEFLCNFLSRKIMFEYWISEGKEMCYVTSKLVQDQRYI